jgi:hypothetical protein
LIRPASICLIRRRVLAARAEERGGAARADEVRERFVEDGLPTREECRVRDLVDDRVREVEGVLSQRRRQQRIIEEPERAERRRWPQIDVELPGLQIL